MKCDVIYAMVLCVLLGLLCIGCTERGFCVFWQWRRRRSRRRKWRRDGSAYGFFGCCLFLILPFFFDGADRENYGNVVEEVEAGNPDFPENHEFVHQVTLTYSASGVDYSELPQGVFVVSSGANVTVLSSVEDVEFILKGRTKPVLSNIPEPQILN